jgi:hypothetical protein
MDNLIDAISITKNFTLGEFFDSRTAKEKGLINYPDNAEVIVNIYNLTKTLLQPIRDNFGKPLHITSGYRCAGLNELVGGVSNSDHLTGCAADFIISGIDCYQVCLAVWDSPFIFDQLIYEIQIDAEGNPVEWIHISKQLVNNRMETLTKYVNADGLTYTVNGIVDADQFT